MSHHHHRHHHVVRVASVLVWAVFLVSATTSSGIIEAARSKLGKFDQLQNFPGIIRIR